MDNNAPATNSSGLVSNKSIKDLKGNKKLARNSLWGAVAKATALFWFYTQRKGSAKVVKGISGCGCCERLACYTINCALRCVFILMQIPFILIVDTVLGVDCKILETSLAFDWLQSNVAKASCILFMTPRSVKQQTGSDWGHLRPPCSWGLSPGLPLDDWHLSLCVSQTVEEEWRRTVPLLIRSLCSPCNSSISTLIFLFSTVTTEHPSHHCCGDRGQVPGGGGGSGCFSHARARCPDGRVSGDSRCRAQPGAHAALGERARAALWVSRMLLGVRGSAALFAPSKKVCQHLTFALHADLAPANKVVVVCNETINVFCHLERKQIMMMLMMAYYRCLGRPLVTWWVLPDNGVMSTS